jgi:hypothetical protein
MKTKTTRIIRMTLPGNREPRPKQTQISRATVKKTIPGDRDRRPTLNNKADLKIIPGNWDRRPRPQNQAKMLFQNLTSSGFPFLPKLYPNKLSYLIYYIIPI